MIDREETEISTSGVSTASTFLTTLRDTDATDMLPTPVGAAMAGEVCRSGEETLSMRSDTDTRQTKMAYARRAVARAETMVFMPAFSTCSRPLYTVIDFLMQADFPEACQPHVIVTPSDFVSLATH